MPYSSVKLAKQDNPSLYSAMGGKLALMNAWAKYYDEAKVDGAKDPAIVAWIRFKAKHRKEGDQWVRKD